MRSSRRGVALCLLPLSLTLSVAACATRDASDGVFRDTTVPIFSTTRFESGRFAGSWRRNAAFSSSFLSEDCGAAAFMTSGAGMAVDPCGTGQARRHRIEDPGRLIPSSGPSLWVLWVDEGFRTAVIGTPDGSLGWVLERGGGTTPPDRMAAAREILDFNGYKVEALIVR